MTVEATKPTPESTELLARQLREQFDVRLHLWPDVMPAAMRDRAQWLLWRLEWNQEREAAVKTPYYTSGRRRMGDLGGPADVEALSSLEIALARLRASQRWTGIGFALLKGDGLVGIDLDDTFNLDTGEVRDQHLDIIEACASYTERSPSRTGVHIICASDGADSFKHDPAGVEVYFNGRYLACTGDHLADTPADVQPLKRFAHTMLRDIVERSKAEEKAAKAAARAPAAPPAPPAAPSPRPAAGGAFTPGDDFRRVNEEALQKLSDWVPTLFPEASKHTYTDAGGVVYRVTSKALGRKLQEDLQLAPMGIMDYGEEVGMSAIDVVMKWGGQGSARDAMLWLAGRIGLQIEHRRPTGKARPDRPEPPPEAPPPPPAEQPSTPAAEEPGVAELEPTDEAAAALRDIVERQAEERRAGMHLVHDADAAESKAEAPAPSAKRKRSGGAAKPPRDGAEGGWDALERLRKNFALIYGTETVWDGEQRRIMKMAALRLIFGNGAVRWWLEGSERRTVLPEQLLFSPGEAVAAPCINLFDGFAMQPEPCDDEDVDPMLELLYHLCSTTAGFDDRTGKHVTVQDVVNQVLCFLALPLQQPGAKCDFALVFHGPQGTGKNMFFDGVRALYGKYGRMVGQTELEDKFNDWLSAKLMIIGNEVVTRQELYHHKNKLKWLITEAEIPIRGMMQSVRWEANHVNLVFLSNEQQPLALEKDDRRYLVVYTPVAADDELYRRVGRWLKEGGAAKFLDYLLRFQLGDFDTHTKPLMTSAKKDLIELGLKPAERFAREWLGGFLELPLWPCSAGQLYTVFRKWCDQSGERFWPPQYQFTESVKKYAIETAGRDPDTGKPRPPALTYKVVALATDQASKRKSDRCFIPRGCGAPAGNTEGKWMAECVTKFEDWVREFTRPRRGGETPEADA